MRTATTAALTLSLAATLIAGLTSGCSEPKKSAKNTAKIKTRETINKKTQVVLKLSDALAKGGVLADMTIAATDPLTQTAAGYRTSVGKIGIMSVENAINVRNAQSIADPKPLSYEEFMAEIIKKGQPDGIQLAMLPFYQEYAWDEPSQKLVVVEFPALKEQQKKEQDEELGRR